MKKIYLATLLCCLALPLFARPSAKMVESFKQDVMQITGTGASLKGMNFDFDITIPQPEPAPNIAPGQNDDGNICATFSYTKKNPIYIQKDDRKPDANNTEVEEDAVNWYMVKFDGYHTSEEYVPEVIRIRPCENGICKMCVQKEEDFNSVKLIWFSSDKDFLMQTADNNADLYFNRFSYRDSRASAPKGYFFTNLNWYGKKLFKEDSAAEYLNSYKFDVRYFSPMPEEFIIDTSQEQCLVLSLKNKKISYIKTSFYINGEPNKINTCSLGKCTVCTWEGKLRGKLKISFAQESDYFGYAERGSPSFKEEYLSTEDVEKHNAFTKKVLGSNFWRYKDTAATLIYIRDVRNER